MSKSTAVFDVEMLEWQQERDAGRAVDAPVKPKTKTTRESVDGIQYAAMSLQEKSAAQLAGLKAQSWGKKGEKQTAVVLARDLGHMAIREVKIHWRIVPVDKNQPNGYYTRGRSWKAPGDILSIAPSNLIEDLRMFCNSFLGTNSDIVIRKLIQEAIKRHGCGVPALTEVKAHGGPTLAWSKLSRPKKKTKDGWKPQPHQSESLIKWEADGGLSLLSWVRKKPNGRYETAVMRWPDVVAAGFKPSKSISWETAVKLAINKR